MKKLTTSRRLSIIHAVKCEKSTSFKVAKDSSDQLLEFMNRLNILKSDELPDFLKAIQAWADTNPIVTENNIEELNKK